MTLSPPKRAFDWEAAGQELGKRLSQYHALVVIGTDPVSTGRVAIGLARTQAAHRRVAVGDLFAESPPIQELVQSDDPHGLVDSFLYGVSLSRIAYEVPGAGQLYVMPSGSEPPMYDEILPNPRWYRLVAGFREVKALLVLAVPSSAPHVDDLVSATDGAILVGEAVPRGLSVSRVIASVREPRLTPVQVVVPPQPPTREPRRWSNQRMAAVAGIALAIIIGTIGAWLAYRPLARGAFTTRGPKPDTTKGVTQGLKKVLSAGPTDTAVRFTPTPGGTPAPVSAPVATPPNTPATPLSLVPPVSNRADSAIASVFAVELTAHNTQAGAILNVKAIKDLPAATYAPALVSGGGRWFKIYSGAYATRAGADSLLQELRKRKKLKEDAGSVARLPFAFLIESGVKATAVPGMVAQFADGGFPVYALRQEDGTAWLLVGAFDSPEQAALYTASLPSGVPPILVYRKGRVF